MNREQLIQRVDSGWQGFAAACQGLPADALLEPGVVGEWSVKDLMAHIATWELESLAALPVIAQGGRAPRYVRYGGIDGFNLLKWREFQAWSADDLHARLVQAHLEILAFLGAVEENLFATETRFRRRLRWDTYGHYREHARQVLEWREARSL